MNLVRAGLAVAAIISYPLSVQGTTVIAPPEDLRGITIVDLDLWSKCGYVEFPEALKVIQPQAELRLKEAGIRIEPESEMTVPFTTPRLQIDVECGTAAVTKKGQLVVSAGPHFPELEPDIKGFLFQVHVRLFQRVALARNPKVMIETATYSWDGWLSAERKARPFTELRREVLRGVDEFVGMWRYAQTDRSKLN
jgi:hypothetical protein